MRNTDSNSLVIPKQHFIPFSCHDVEGICRATNFVEGEMFEQHRHLFSRLINIQYQSLLEQLKLSYAPYNPDLDTKVWQQQRVKQPQELATLVGQMLNAANYVQLTADDLALALNAQSLCKIRLDVDFNEFSQLLVFSRGEHIVKRTVTRLGRFGHKRLEFVNFERVFILLQFQDRQWFIDRKREVPEHIQPGAIMLKLFKDVPKADLETLFPNTKIKMRNLDKLLIGVPALASGGLILATKLSATLVLSAALISFSLGWSKQPVVLDQNNMLILGAGLATLGGYLWKQFSAFKHRKIKFMQSLTDSLYYKALDNNVGVFHYLIDNAKESEGKELILAWTFMHQLKRATAHTLDSAIETYFESTLDSAIDFDVQDALAKLLRLDLVTLEGTEYVVRDLQQSYQHLLAQWQRSSTL